MDIYTISFFLSTFWIGPFWFSMLFKPYDNETIKKMDKPLFFLGPIFIWFFIMFTNPAGLNQLISAGSNPDGLLIGIGKSMMSKAGISAMWAHMVAGDIFATRWIWKKCTSNKNNIWITRLCVFFGVMLMPLGILICLLYSIKKSKK